MKPIRPYKTFPLTPHHRGGWAKRYKGHQLYLPDHNPDKALQDFHRRAAAIDSGKLPVRTQHASDITVKMIVTKYTHERQQDVDAKRLDQVTYDEYEDAGAEMVAEFGRRMLVDDLTPDHFTALYRRFDKRLGAHAMAKRIQRIRTIWKHAEENDWIDRRPKFGSAFKKPQAGKKKIPPPTIAEVRFILQLASGQLRAMILLGLNAAYTAKDCAALPRAAVSPGLIVFPRPKMARRNPIERAATLWPITDTLLAEVMHERPKDALVFRTAYGAPWVRYHVDSVGLMYGRLCKAYGIRKSGFAALRHVFRTLADELERPSATNRIMGHRGAGLSDVYVDKIEHSRLHSITEHAYWRLFHTWKFDLQCDWPQSEPSPSH